MTLVKLLQTRKHNTVYNLSDEGSNQILQDSQNLQLDSHQLPVLSLYEKLKNLQYKTKIFIRQNFKTNPHFNFLIQIHI